MKSILLKITFHSLKALVLPCLILVSTMSAVAQQPYSAYGPASYYKAGYIATTASGEIYNARLFTASHASLPFGTLVQVTHLKKNTSVIVRVNDRPLYNTGHVIDLSYGAADKLGMLKDAVAEVSVTEVKVAATAQRRAVPQPPRGVHPNLRGVAHPNNSNSAQAPRGLVPVSAASAKANANIWDQKTPESTQVRERLPELAPAEDGSSLNRPVLRVQFGVFSQATHAQQVQADLQRRGVPTDIVELNTIGGQKLRVVTRGVFFDYEGATKWLNYVKRSSGHYQDAFVTR